VNEGLPDFTVTGAETPQELISAPNYKSKSLSFDINVIDSNRACLIDARSRFAIASDMFTLKRLAGRQRATQAQV
jgi:hypothetical protein